MVDYRYIALLLSFQAPLLSTVIFIYYSITLGRNGYTRTEHFLARALGILCLVSLIFEISIGLMNYGFIDTNENMYQWSCIGGYSFMLICAIVWSEFSLSRAHNPSVVLSVLIRILYFVVFVVITARIAFKDTEMFMYYEDGVAQYGPFDDIQTYGCILIYALLEVVIILRYTDKKEYVYKERHGKLLFGNSIIFIAILIYGTLFLPYMVTVGHTLLILYIYMYNQKSSIYKDELTHLANRRMMIKDISAKIHEGISWSFIMIDVDSFKSINDKFGHSEGDIALETVASVIGNVAKTHGGTAYRYGGDEFSVIIDSSVEQEIAGVCEEINASFARENQTGNTPYLLSVSCGFASYNSDTMESIPDIIESADKKMYDIKQAKKKQNQ